MPVVKNAEAREIPWRPGYRNYVLAGEAEGAVHGLLHEDGAQGADHGDGAEDPELEGLTG